MLTSYNFIEIFPTELLVVFINHLFICLKRRNRNYISCKLRRREKICDKKHIFIEICNTVFSFLANQSNYLDLHTQSDHLYNHV